MTEGLRLQVAGLIIVSFLLVNYFSARRNIQSNNTFLFVLVVATVNTVVDFVHSFLHEKYDVQCEWLFKLYLITLLVFLISIHRHISKIVLEKGGRINIRPIIWYVVSAIEIVVFSLSDVSHLGMADGVVTSSIGQTFIYILMAATGLSCIVMICLNWHVIGRQDRVSLLLSVICVNVVYIIEGNLIQESISCLGNTIIVMVIYMVTDNPDMLLIKKLQSERDRANSANMSKSSFVAHVSHEIRTPINAIIGMDEMILRETENENTRLYATDIKHAANKLYGIINNVLDVSKMESGKLDIFPTEYSLNQLIYDSVFVSMPKIKDKQLEFYVNMNGSLPESYFGDDVHIKQVLTNLISNAVKYTHEGFVKLSIDGNIKGDLIDLTFEVRDSGIGIKEEDISKLFVPFERIEESRNRNIEGTGLGMNITYNLLKLMGSRLNVSSVYGEGSVFSFTVTQRIVSMEPVGDYTSFSRKQESSETVGFIAPLVRILVVDDNALNRRVFKSLLARTEMIIDEASGGYECLDMIKKEAYDMIFIDHLMPDLDGIKTLVKMREDKEHKNAKTPVIMLTANALDGIWDEYNQAGFNAYLSKPIFSNELEKLIRVYIPSYKIVTKGNLEVTATKEITNSANWKEELPSIRGIDWEEAFEHLPTEDILKSTLQGFYENIEKDSKELDKYVDAIEVPENIELFRIKVHAIKGEALMLGAEMLSEGAKELEIAANDKNIDVIKEKYPYMINYYRSFIDKLSCFGFESENKNTQRKADCKQALALMEMIRLEMQGMNKQSALDLTVDLNECGFDADVKNKILRLRNSIEEFDFERVELLIESIKKDIKLLEMS